MKNLQSILFLSIAFAIGFSACKKKEFDQPPFSGDVDPNLPVNISIKNLKALYSVNDFYRKPLSIGDDLTIAGIVTANDKSGNFYKQIIIQDTSGAVAVNINRSSLYGDFPIGRKVYVKCQGLSLGDYGQFIQLGYGTEADGSLGSIPTTLMDDYVVPASFPHVVEPKVISVSDVDAVVSDVIDNTDLVGMLVQFERVQFKSNELGKTYADPSTQGSGTNRELKDCSDFVINLRTSNYSQFQPKVLPQGSGELTAIYSRYFNDAQLIIRDETDVNFDKDRCPFGTAADTLMRIADLRSLYSGTEVVIKNGRIRGVVISDRDDVVGNNITSRNMVLQDGDRGIMVRFASGSENDWKMGDSLEVLIAGQKLSESGRWLQIGDQVLASDVQKIGVGKVTPRVATIADIIANFEDWESTLVTIKNALVVSASSSNGYYQGTVDLNDGSSASDFPLFTQSYAKFSAAPAPVGQTKDFTGFLYSITSKDRISIRRLTDVSP